MSAAVADTVARVGELQALIARSRVAPAQPPAVAFDTTLAAAQPTAAPTGAPATAAPTGGPSTYDALINQSAAAHGIDPALLKGLIAQESNFDPTAGSSAGARGLTQLMPGTAAALGVTDVTDPAQAIEGGAKYLAQQLQAFGGDTSLALAAYNAGPGAVERYDGIPPYPETQNYVRSVLAKAQGFAA